LDQTEVRKGDQEKEIHEKITEKGQNRGQGKKGVRPRKEAKRRALWE